MKKETVIAKAPMRFDLAGGPTDISPFSDIEGGAVVNVAIDRYATVKISPRTDDNVHIVSKDIGAEALFSKDDLSNENGPLRLIAASIGFLMPNIGVDVETFVDAPVGSGLGASAALAVALVGALRIFNGEKVIPLVAAEDALYVENELLHVINGGQDQFASAFGGFNVFQFENGKVKREDLIVAEDVIQEFQNKCLLVYNGETRISGKVLEKVMKDYQDGVKSVAENLRNIKNCAELISRMLRNGELENLGVQLLSVFNSQVLLHPDVATQNIKEIMRFAETIGIEGGKIAGAGGGGMMLLYSAPETMSQLEGMLWESGYLTNRLLVSKDGLMCKFVEA